MVLESMKSFFRASTSHPSATLSLRVVPSCQTPPRSGRHPELLHSSPLFTLPQQALIFCLFKLETQVKDNLTGVLGPEGGQGDKL